MSTPEYLQAIVVAFAAFWAAYVLLLPVAAVLRSRRPVPVQSTTPGTGAESDAPRVVVIVPSHNMEAVINRCIESVRACKYPLERLTIVVVADHCTDSTAGLAAAAGATVLERNSGPPGKTYALAWTFKELSARGMLADLHVVTDATARLDPGFLHELLPFWHRGESIIVGHSIVDLSNERWFAQCLGLTLVHRNLQNEVRERLGLSALIEGRGMAYHRDYIHRHGWSLAVPDSDEAGTHPTEDWRHGVRVVEHGYRVAFAHEARVVTPLRDSLTAATQQGARWERGRMANAGTHALRLLRLGLRERNRLKIFAALDALQPPAAILAGICVAVAALSLLLPSGSPIFAVSFLPLLMVAVYSLLVVAQGWREGIRLATVAWAPVYVLWRGLSFLLAWTFFDRLKFAKHKKREKNA
jgi:cellulose synthase/poly-beta-1,6-N-acetylglucosamine synthase-like glycosyltransferase